MLHGRRFAADHHAVTALEPPHAAARADVDVVNAFRRQLLGAANVVDVVRIAAVDQDVVLVEQRHEIADARIDDGGRHHQPDRTRLAQLLDEIGERRGALRAVRRQRRDRLAVAIVDDAGVAIALQPAHHVRAHPAKTDHSELHYRLLVETWRGFDVFSNRRNPPVNACALSPIRQPFGSFFNFFALPPPSTMSSGASASISRAVPTSTCFCPLLAAAPLQGANAEITLPRAVAVRQVRQFHRHDDAVGDQRGAETGAETEKQQQSALVAAERLHRGIVDDLNRTAERRLEIKADPTLARDCAVRS